MPWAARPPPPPNHKRTRLTWQAIAGVGYAFNWGNVLATWRYLDYENSSGEPLEGLDMSGPQLTVAFPF